MVKDNHVRLIDDLGKAIESASAVLPHTTHIEVEVDRLDLIEPVLASGEVDTILLDNFSLEALRQGVELVGGRAIVEASGGVTLATIAEVAATGVDVISVGALTHSVRALDLALDFR
jgi:nicotinate-nucleotide pyrophosphorylase (carboxylating)